MAEANGPGRGSAEHEDVRLRDLPAPRQVKGVIAPVFRVIFAWPYRAVLLGLYRAGIRPWQLTLASFLNNVVVGWLLLKDLRFLPGILLLPAGLLDIFDGGVARLRHEDSRAGAFLDSVMDRLSDAIVFGCLFWSLSREHMDLQAALCMSALVISLSVSHLRAEGEALGLTLSEGVMQRLERYVVLMIGLTAPGALLPVLVILTALGAVTVLQRGWFAMRRLAAPVGTPDTGTSSVPPP
jgi:CDP-diacylglycerol---glycerol-3-phosphate 3-phosphatidyltransferase